MALFFLVLFSPKPHLHDKQCHFEAACVIYAICHSFMTFCSCLSSFFFFFLSTVIPFFVTVSLSHTILFIYLWYLPLSSKQVFGSKENGKDISVVLLTMCYSIWVLIRKKKDFELHLSTTNNHQVCIIIIIIIFLIPLVINYKTQQLDHVHPSQLISLLKIRVLMLKYKYCCYS